MNKIWKSAQGKEFEIHTAHRTLMHPIPSIISVHPVHLWL